MGEKTEGEQAGKGAGYFVNIGNRGERLFRESCLAEADCVTKFAYVTSISCH